MKHIGLALLAFSVLSFAQSPQTATQAQPDQKQPVQMRGGQRAGSTVSDTPDPDDMYCSGFITTQKVPESRYVVAGQNSPDQARYAGASDRVFIWGASDLKAGDRLQILRHVHNPNRYERYVGEHKAIQQAGEPYFERGYVRIQEVQKNVAVAIPELSCGDMMPGDLAIPFEERQTPTFRKVTLDRYTPPNGKVTGRIVMANEFDSSVGYTQKVYLSIGEDKGLKVGDYLRVTRTYDYSYGDPETGLSTYAIDLEDTAYHAPKIPKTDLKGLPRLTLGDVIILTVHPRSATAMVVTALEDIRVGDNVELMDDAGSAANTATPGDGQP